MNHKTTEERFLEKIYPEPNSGCWLWSGAVNNYGYGQIRIDGRIVYAHRYSYELYVSEIPGGMELDHKCRNPYCVNPNHLEPVTHRENILRGMSPSARQARQKFCVHGHSLIGDNLYLRKSGGRNCKTCNRERQRRYKLESRQCQ